jgi:hypothetical protein
VRGRRTGRRDLKEGGAMSYFSKRPLRFSVSRALLGGGVALAGAAACETTPEYTVNPGPVELTPPEGAAPDAGPASGEAPKPTPTAEELPRPIINPGPVEINGPDAGVDAGSPE